MRALALYGALGSLVLTGLASPPAGGAVHDPAAPPAPVHPLAFGRCAAVEHLPSSVECATLTVPLDYARPNGKKIKLMVSRARATAPRERQGALVFNPGGPGASSMQFPLYGTLPTWRRSARAYDFVGYAPRGVGRSNPLSCQDPKKYAQAPTDSPRFPSAAFKRKKVAEAKAYARGCAQRIGADLPFYNSVNNARDLDMLRAALGEKKLTFMGASYGTYFGAIYATLFPGHVRRMIFDSVVNPEPRQIWYRNNLDQSTAFERRWGDWLRWVAKHHATYRLGNTPQAVRRSYDTARERLRGKPVNGKIGPGQLQSAFLKTGYNDAFWPMRADALSKYLHGDAKPLIAQALPGGDAKAEENANAVYTAVECNDAAWPRDWRTWDRDNTVLARTAPFETWDNVWMNLPCAFWPDRHQSAARGVEDAARNTAHRAAKGSPSGGELADATQQVATTDLDDALHGQRGPLDIRTEPGALPPVLLLAAERDAATPYTGALELQRRLPGSSLVTERGAGTHGIALGDNACVNTYVETYLLRGKVPGHRVYCSPRAEPVPGQTLRRSRQALVQQVKGKK